MTAAKESDPLIEAYYLLKQEGLNVNVNEGDYSNSNLRAMEDAVKVINNRRPKLEEPFRTKAILKYFLSFRNLDSFQNIVSTSVVEQMKKQLISEEEDHFMIMNKQEERKKVLST
jgi:hypothetical protein